MGGLGALGGDLVGYLVPFLFVLTIVVFFHELGHFLVARWCGIRVLVFLDRFRSRTGRLQRPPRHALENLRHSARRLCEILRRRECGQRARPGGRRRDDRGRAQGQLCPPAGRPARRRRGGRPDREFHPGDRDFRRHFHDLSASRPPARASTRSRPDSAAAAAGFKPGDLVLSIDGEQIDSFADMQRIVSISAGEPLELSRSNAAACSVTLKATPALKEVKDNFGNVHRIGVLGISRSMAPGDIKTQPVGPLTAVGFGVKETWFVVDRTLSYIGGVIRRPGSGRPARRPDPDRPGVRPGGDRRLRAPSCIWPPCCRSRSAC